MVKPLVIDLRSYKQSRMSQLPTPLQWRKPLAYFVTWMRAADFPRTTEKLRHYHLRRFANTTGAAPFEVTYDDLITYMGAHDWSPSTKRSNRSSLRSFYGWAHASGHMDTNPAALLPKIPTLTGKPRPAPDLIVTEGLDRAGEREHLMILLAATASMRACEIAVAHVDDLVGDRGGYELVVHGKGRKERLVPVSDSLARTIRERGAANGGWLFPGQIDGHLSAKRVTEVMADALPGKWTAHTLRHRFATKAYQNTGDLRAVQELLGHASVATTQVYTAIDDAARRRAALSAAVA